MCFLRTHPSLPEPLVSLPLSSNDDLVYILAPLPTPTITDWYMKRVGASYSQYTIAGYKTVG